TPITSPLSLHDALPICQLAMFQQHPLAGVFQVVLLEFRTEIVGELRDGDETGADLQRAADEELPDEQERHQPAPALLAVGFQQRSEEHTSELQSHLNLV